MSLVRFRVRAPLFKEPSLWLGFCFSAYRTLHRTPFDDSLLRSSPLRGQRDRRAVQTPAALVRIRAPLFKEPSLWLGFCFLRTGLFIRRYSTTDVLPHPPASLMLPYHPSPYPIDCTYSTQCVAASDVAPESEARCESGNRLAKPCKNPFCFPVFKIEYRAQQAYHLYGKVPYKIAIGDALLCLLKRTSESI